MGIKKVAVLESNGETAQGIAECLRGEGFEVCGVTDDVEEGLRTILSEEADVDSGDSDGKDENNKK